MNYYDEYFINNLVLGSKWSMSMNDYPYNYFPPYIAGMYVHKISG